MIKLKDLLNESVFVALALNRGRASTQRSVSRFDKAGMVGGILQANADRMFKSEVSRNISPAAASKLKVLSHHGQAGLRGSKKTAKRSARQYVDAVSGEIKAPDNAVEWFKDGQIIKTTKTLDLIFSKSRSGLKNILKKKYKIVD
tara:strand:+ start:56 stop:490 length:435 start_codon:yes stop_codon:yes gene_type:complete